MPDLVTIVAAVVSVALACGANARWARLWTEDEITQGMRNRIGKRFGHSSFIYRWINCPWCFGMWWAAPISALAWFPIMGTQLWWVYPLALGSVAHAAGRLNHNHGS